ncbi:OLC1v1021534C1 [Oldenlandia corymbosa var. corymbosa]|uniref:OLC1v1021534C1 n=1 Tax=Oldenlandia corymbosa var. corymbosa TaxID=529605 RepID=A0AAV1BVW3_OLDCO|nr:OLC1v1021534C1 [Oldenlandia corymbosa var. corymbosa]
MTSAPKSNGKRRAGELAGELDDLKPEKLKRVVVEDDFDAELSSDIRGIFAALKQLKEKAHKDGLKKNEETISSVASGIKSDLDELRTKLEKDRQAFAKALSKSSKECENMLKTETAKFQAVYEKFCKETSTHLQSLKDVFAKYDEEKERLLTRYEQMRKKEKNSLAELEKACNGRIVDLEGSLKKKKQDDKTFSLLKQTLGSFLDNASDEEFPSDD